LAAGIADKLSVKIGKHDLCEVISWAARKVVRLRERELDSHLIVIKPILVTKQGHSKWLK
jgi:hypothetical protein